MKIIDKSIYFDNDDELYAFCIVPELIPIAYTDSNGVERHYADFEFTPQCKKAIDDGITFIVKDEDSQVFKHGGVTFRTIFKELNNLGQWFDDKE